MHPEQRDTAQPRPPWIRVKRLSGAARELMQRSLQGLNTVCVSANCPNVGECWARGTATFMIMGDRCTRGCPFCDVELGKPAPLDPEEPARLAASIKQLQLKYAVITCVDRDDLADGGAAHWAACIEAIRDGCSAPDGGGPRIEVLTGDFRGSAELVAVVINARPDVFVHNVETVPRLQRSVRRGASWEASVAALLAAREAADKAGIPLLTKSGLMLGLGETLPEVREALLLLRRADVDLVTIGQYLKPRHVEGKLEVQRYATPEEFAGLAEYAMNLGFKGAASSPLTRSSHLAETMYAGASAGGQDAAD